MTTPSKNDNESSGADAITEHTDDRHVDDQYTDDQHTDAPHAEINARTIFGLALPALGVLAAMPLYLLLDTAIVGRLGSFELAALGAGATVQSMLTTQLTFLSYGTTARASRLYGQGKKSSAIAEGVQATWVALAVGGLLATVLWIFGTTIAQWLTGDPQVASATASWLHVSALAIPLTLVIMAGNGWMRGIQNTRWPFYFTLAGVIPGAITLPFLVSSFGLVGSAWANVFGMGLTATCFVVCLLRAHDGSWAPRSRVIIRQLVLGRDLILRSLAFQVAFLSAAGVAARFGTHALAAHQIMLQLWNFLTLVLDSLAIAAQALIGAALGSKTVAKARSTGLRITWYSTIFALCLAVIFVIFSGWIPRVFTDDPGVLEAIATPWWLLVSMIVLGGVLFAFDGVLLGAGDVAFLRTITIASVVLGFLPGVWLAYLVDGGLTGIWCGLLAFIALRTLAVVYRFQSMKWAVTD